MELIFTCYFALISKHPSIPVKVLQQLRGWLQSETRQTLHCLVLRRCCRSFHYDETPQRPSAQCNMDHRVLKHSACFVAHATAMKERPHHSLGLAWWPLLGPTGCVCWIAGWEKTRLALSCSSVWNTVIRTPKIFPNALIYIWWHGSFLGGEPGTEMVANQLAKVHLQLWAG